MKTLNYGTLPERADIDAATDGDTYLIGGNFRQGMPAIVDAINQGIDAHLEAVRFDTADNGDISIAPQSMPTLLRRLVEMFDAGNEEAGDDASCILETLGFEWM